MVVFMLVSIYFYLTFDAALILHEHAWYGSRRHVSVVSVLYMLQYRCMYHTTRGKMEEIRACRPRVNQSNVPWPLS